MSRNKTDKDNQPESASPLDLSPAGSLIRCANFSNAVSKDCRSKGMLFEADLFAKAALEDLALAQEIKEEGFNERQASGIQPRPITRQKGNRAR